MNTHSRATGATPRPRPRPGDTVLGCFRLEQQIGAGSFATAYLAEQLGTDRRAVVKIPHPHLLRGPHGAELRRRFDAKAKAATRTKHPNLVTVYIVGETQYGAPTSAHVALIVSNPVMRAQLSSYLGERRGLARPAPMAHPETERCTLLVLHNDHEALLAALLVANGAAAQGMDTTVFFTFWGLNLLRGPGPNSAEPEPKIGLMQRLMKWMMPKGPKRQPLGKMHFGGLGKGMLSAIMRSQEIMSLPELLDSAQQLGGILDEARHPP